MSIIRKSRDDLSDYIVNHSLTTAFNGNPVETDTTNGITFAVFIESGTPTGDMILQAAVGNRLATGQPNILGWLNLLDAHCTAGLWDTVDGNPITAIHQSFIMLDVATCAANYYRLAWIPTGGTGTVSASWTQKSL